MKPYFEGLEQVIGLIKEKEQTNLSTLHTDQGSVYSSEAFNKLLTNNNIIHSMSRAGTPTDNPIDESINGWIKEELFIDFNLKKCDNVLSLIETLRQQFKSTIVSIERSSNRQRINLNNSLKRN